MINKTKDMPTNNKGNKQNPRVESQCSHQEK